MHINGVEGRDRSDEEEMWRTSNRKLSERNSVVWVEEVDQARGLLQLVCVCGWRIGLMCT